MLYSSYLIKKLEDKVFCLFGTEIDKEKVLAAIEIAKKEYKKNSDLEIEINWTKDKKVLLQFKLTKIIKLKGLLYLPNNSWDNILLGNYYNFETKDYIKVGGNYAASMRPADRAHKNGFASVLFLDALEKKYIDEAGPANFFGIKGNKYITPKSQSILPSITNMSLEQIAKDIGLEVERRSLTLEELSTFEEAGACGTAAIITPIKKIVDHDTGIEYEYGNEAGPVSTKLYNQLRGIQEGTIEDVHGWTEIIEGI